MGDLCSFRAKAGPAACLFEEWDELGLQALLLENPGFYSLSSLTDDLLTL